MEAQRSLLKADSEKRELEIEEFKTKTEYLEAMVVKLKEQNKHLKNQLESNEHMMQKVEDLANEIQSITKEKQALKKKLSKMESDHKHELEQLSVNQTLLKD